MNSKPALVTADPEVCGGRPCFAGHRVPVAMVLRRLDAEEGLADLQQEFPWLTDEHVAAARAYPAPEPARRFGVLARKVVIAPDFDAPLLPDTQASCEDDTNP